MQTRDMKSIWQLLKFIISGGTNVLLTLLVFWVLIDWVLLPYPLASVLTWFVGISVNLSFMWFWVFPGNDLRDFMRTFGRHFVFHLCYYLFNLALLVLFSETTGSHPLIVQSVLLIFLLPLNFLGTKYLVMRTDNSAPKWFGNFPSKKLDTDKVDPFQ